MNEKSEAINVRTYLFTDQTVSPVVVIHPFGSAWVFFADSVEEVGVGADVNRFVNQVAVLPDRQKKEAVQAFELGKKRYISE